MVGETAPLLLIAGLTTRTNFNVFSERMTTLPVLIYTQNANPGIAETPGGAPAGIEIAWGGALVLILDRHGAQPRGAHHRQDLRPQDRPLSQNQ